MEHFRSVLLQISAPGAFQWEYSPGTKTVDPPFQELFFRIRFLLVFCEKKTALYVPTRSNGLERTAQRVICDVTQVPRYKDLGSLLKELPRARSFYP